MKFIGSKNGQILFATDYEVLVPNDVELIKSFDTAHFSTREIVKSFRVWGNSLIPKSVKVAPEIMRIALVGRLHDNPMSALNYRNLNKIVEHVSDWQLVPSADREWVENYNPDYIVVDLDSIMEPHRKKWEHFVNSLTKRPMLLRTSLADTGKFNKIKPYYIAYDEVECNNFRQAGFKCHLIREQDVVGSYIGLLSC